MQPYPHPELVDRCIVGLPKYRDGSRIKVSIIGAIESFRTVATGQGKRSPGIPSVIHIMDPLIGRILVGIFKLKIYHVFVDIGFYISQVVAQGKGPPGANGVPAAVKGRLGRTCRTLGR
jgi:hypothetical protein